jgi:hypothetical protein
MRVHPALCFDSVWSVKTAALRAGNDLARCLNWGGGLYALREGGLPAALRDVEHATVALLDRWEVWLRSVSPQ